MPYRVPIGHVGAVLWISVLLAGCSPQTTVSAPELPVKLGGLALHKTISGVEAGKRMYRMHGNPLGSRASLIGCYGGAGSDNKLYISCFETEAHAVRALEKMLERMTSSRAGFAPAAQDTSCGQVAYTTKGRGLYHFFYTTNNLVVWLQVEPEIARETSCELRRHHFTAQEKKGAFEKELEAVGTASDNDS